MVKLKFWNCTQRKMTHFNSTVTKSILELENGTNYDVIIIF